MLTYKTLIRLTHIVTLVLMLSTCSWAYPRNIVRVPIAKNWDKRQVAVEFVQGIEYIDSDEDVTTSIQTAYGVTDRLELGLDLNSIGEGDKLLATDFKYQFIDTEDHLWGFAGGAFNIGPDYKPVYFAVGTGNYGKASITTGYATSDLGFLLGTNYKLTNNFSTFAELLSGSDGGAAAGLGYSFSKLFSAQVYWQELEANDLERVQIELVFTF